MPGPLADIIEQELDRLAQLEKFPDFISKLQATITPHFKDADAAADWSRLTAENVVDDWLTHRYVLRTGNRKIRLARRPHVSTTDVLRKLAKCVHWEQAWFGLPKDAHYALRVAAVETKRGMRLQYYDPQFKAWYPSQESVVPLIDPAIAVAPVFNTNSKFERDALLGFMLRMWRVRNTDHKNPWVGPPRHDAAWRFIERIEACYRPFFAKYDPASAAPRRGFDIPLRKETRESIYKRFVLWQQPEPNPDIQKFVDMALSPWKAFT